MTSPFELKVSGRLPQALMQLISTRFGNIALIEQQNGTVLYGGVADQAALRALLCLIWDNGGTLVSVTVHNGAEDREAGRDPYCAAKFAGSGQDDHHVSSANGSPSATRRPPNVPHD